MGNSMVQEYPPQTMSEPSTDEVRQQLAVLLADKAFRTSRRSKEFLRYVVEQTLDGAAENIKERTIGMEVFGRQPSYETASDHVVRTAAIDVRKRLAIYYSDPQHGHEIRVTLVPGSYVPQFAYPAAEGSAEPAVVAAGVPPDEPTAVVALPPEARSHGRVGFLCVLSAVLAAAVVLVVVGADSWVKTRTPEYLFWKPLLQAPGPVLLAAGESLSGPPSVPSGGTQGVPVIQRETGSDVPMADTITIARVLNALESRGQRVVIRPEVGSSFADLKQSPSVLIGAFNNEWSLRLSHPLRYSLELDTARHLIYIRDAEHPESRTWSQVTGSTLAEQERLRGGPVTKDYALISRVRDPETGQVTVIVGGLYSYGTQAAGEFISSPAEMQQLAKVAGLGDGSTDVQVVLETPVTDETPGVARVLALSATR